MSNQPTEYEQAGYNSPDGLQIGNGASEKVALYGAALIVQPSMLRVVFQVLLTSALPSLLGRRKSRIHLSV